MRLSTLNINQVRKLSSKTRTDLGSTFAQSLHEQLKKKQPFMTKYSMKREQSLVTAPKARLLLQWCEPLVSRRRRYDEVTEN